MYPEGPLFQDSVPDFGPGRADGALQAGQRRLRLTADVRQGPKSCIMAPRSWSTEAGWPMLLLLDCGPHLLAVTCRILINSFVASTARVGALTEYRFSWSVQLCNYDITVEHLSRLPWVALRPLQNSTYVHRVVRLLLGKSTSWERAPRTSSDQHFFNAV